MGSLIADPVTHAVFWPAWTLMSFAHDPFIAFIEIALAVIVLVTFAMIVTNKVTTYSCNARFPATTNAITRVRAVYTGDFTLIADPVFCA